MSDKDLYSEISDEQPIIIGAEFINYVTFVLVS